MIALMVDAELHEGRRASCESVLALAFRYLIALS